MAKKSSIGYPTIKEAKNAIRAIVNQYPVNVEFFHPLLQQLFIEQPYWCRPPGPTFTKFIHQRRLLPSGAIYEKEFNAFDPSTGRWKSFSWNKAAEHYSLNVKKELAELARNYVRPIIFTYRIEHPICEYENCTSSAQDVHHVVSMKQIIDEAYALLTQQDVSDIEAKFDFWSTEKFVLPNNHKFIQRVIVCHQPGILQSYCKIHHNLVEGKQTHDHHSR